MFFYHLMAIGARANHNDKFGNCLLTECLLGERSNEKKNGASLKTLNRRFISTSLKMAYNKTTTGRKKVACLWLVCTSPINK